MKRSYTPKRNILFQMFRKKEIFSCNLINYRGGYGNGIFYDCIVITFSLSCDAVSRNTCNQTKIAINGTETDYLQKSGCDRIEVEGCSYNLEQSANVRDLILEWDGWISINTYTLLFDVDNSESSNSDSSTLKLLTSVNPSEIPSR